MKEIVGVLKVDIGDSEKQIHSLLEAVENLKKSLAEIDKVEIDFGNSIDIIKTLTEEINKLNGNVSVNLDLGNSLETIDKLNEELDKLNGNVSVNVDLGDGLENIQKLEDEISNLNAEVEIDLKEGDSEKQIQSLLKEIENLKKAIQSLEGKGLNNAVQIDTTAEKSIKTLRDEIKQYKTALESAEIGSEQFKIASEGLINAQNQLKSALASTKEQAEDAEGSYNALVKTMAELKKQWRATADEIERAEIGKQIAEINSQLKELDFSIDNHQRNVGNYAESFSEAMRAQQEATELTRAKLESLQKVASGLASGYSAVQGAMALMGTENEKLEKTFVKLQAAIALAQGIGGMKDLIEGVGQAKVAFQGAIMGVKSFIGALSAMKTALLATGIGALVVALGTIIAYWDDISAMFGDSEREIKRINDAVDELQRKLTQKDREDNFLVRMAVAAGKAKDEILELKRAQASENYEEADKKKLEAQAKVDKLEKEDWKWNGESEELKAAKEALKQITEEADKRLQTLKDANDDISVYEEEQRTKKREDEKKEADEKLKKSNETAKKELEETKKKEEEIKKEAEKIRKESLLSLMTDKDKELAVLQEKYEKEKSILQSENKEYQTLVKAHEKSVDEINRKYAEIEKGDIEIKVKVIDEGVENLKALHAERQQTLKEQFEKEYALLGDNEEKKNALQKEYDEQVIKIEQEFNAKVEELQKGSQEALEETKRIELDILNNAYLGKLSIFEKEEQGINNLTQAYQKAVDEVTEKYKELGGKDLITTLNAEIKVTEQTADNKAIDVENKYAIKQADTESPIDSIQLEIDKTLELQAIREQAFNEQMAQIQALLDSKQLTAEQEKELAEQYAELQMQRINETAKATTQIAILDRQLIKEQKKQNQEYAKNLTQTFTSTLQGVSNILGALQDGIDTTNKEGFEKNKKIQTANATIGMLVGITNALAGLFTTKSGPWDLILAGIQAASIATSGAMQISNIQKQTFDGGNSSAVATPNLSVAESMPVQYTKEILTDTETEKLNQPIKCYVLENDIREAHNKVDVAEGNATF